MSEEEFWTNLLLVASSNAVREILFCSTIVFHTTSLTLACLFATGLIVTAAGTNPFATKCCSCFKQRTLYSCD